MKTNEKISYLGKRVFVGIDVHRKFYAVSCVCEDKVIKRFRVDGRGELLVFVLKKHFEGAELQSVYEAGFSGFALHRLLLKSGIGNIVVNASSIEVAARDRVKTDKRDSLKLATQLSVGRLRGIRIPSEEEELRRMVTRTREQLVRHRQRLMNQIRMRLHYFGLYDIEDRGRLTEKKVKLVLLGQPPSELQFTIESLMSLWKAANGEIFQMEKCLKRPSENDETVAVWRSLPGFGTMSAQIAANELADLSQFANEERVFSFTGLTPQEHTTSEHRRLGHISRQGSSRLRCLLVEAAWRAIRKDADLREDFERIAARRGKKRAIVAIARKLVGRARAVFRTGEKYRVRERQAA